jgi:hypothetical protein
MEGWLLIAAGVALLVTARSFLAVALDVEPKLFRLNFPRLSRRFERLPDRAGRAAAWSTTLFGAFLGIAAITFGLVELL